ncbi:hypothetical protein FB390_5578 [Nocardia bhagyanarayanae]|uniref:Uncharacterized protein n=1 Tax=Nocardia bhagyanarayanae TaxID=1215925 RepID=A0A543EV29_9NOCA|nr:hypothetical protein FB390_5578 [Nocardia bhagyanarayanae]
MEILDLGSAVFDLVETVLEVVTDLIAIATGSA